MKRETKILQRRPLCSTPKLRQCNTVPRSVSLSAKPPVGLRVRDTINWIPEYKERPQSAQPIKLSCRVNNGITTNTVSQLKNSCRDCLVLPQTAPVFFSFSGARWANRSCRSNRRNRASIHAHASTTLCFLNVHGMSRLWTIAVKYENIRSMIYMDRGMGL